MASSALAAETGGRTCLQPLLVGTPWPAAQSVGAQPQKHTKRLQREGNAALLVQTDRIVEKHGACPILQTALREERNCLFARTLLPPCFLPFPLLPHLLRLALLSPAQSLDLSHNHVEAVPPVLQHMTGLQELNLGRNW